MPYQLTFSHMSHPELGMEREGLLIRQPFLQRSTEKLLVFQIGDHWRLR